EVVDAAVWKAAAAALMDRDLLKKALEDRDPATGSSAWEAQVEGADKVLVQIRREEDQVLRLLRDGIALDAVRARLLTLQRQKDNAVNTKAVAEKAIADRAKAAQNAAGLEAQLRELRVAVKYADTFEKRDAIIAALVPDDGKLATVYPDGRIKLRGLPPLGGAKTSSQLVPLHGELHQAEAEALAAAGKGPAQRAE